MMAEPGEVVSHFAERMQEAADGCFCPVLGEFNQHTFTAWPGDSIATILLPWNKAQIKSYMGG